MEQAGTESFQSDEEELTGGTNMKEIPEMGTGLQTVVRYQGGRMTNQNEK